MQLLVRDAPQLNLPRSGLNPAPRIHINHWCFAISYPICSNLNICFVALKLERNPSVLSPCSVQRAVSLVTRTTIQ
jgi:hypothetical protein